MHRSLLLVSLVALVACSRESSGSASPTPNPNPNPTPTPTPSPNPNPNPTSDFEDQFQYGMLDAGPGDPSQLTTKKTFTPYANGRFGFSLDAPDALTAMPEPDNGDGMQWRLGHLVAMTASGMNWMPDLGGAPCPSSKSVTAHTESPRGCFATGKENGYIFWEKHVISHDVDFSLRFQYVEALKTQMDSIVTRVNASWKF